MKVPGEFSWGFTDDVCPLGCTRVEKVVAFSADADSTIGWGKVKDALPAIGGDSFKKGLSDKASFRNP